MCDKVVNGQFPTDNATLLRLASLRIQYLEGDYEPGAVMYVGDLLLALLHYVYDHIFQTRCHKIIPTK